MLASKPENGGENGEIYCDRESSYAEIAVDPVEIREQLVTFQISSCTGALSRTNDVLS